MEDNKYYTPDISEFHVGFEYENFVKGKGWTKRIVRSLENVQFNEDDAVLDWDDYRVKHLDQDDIESFGWGNFKRTVVHWYELERRIEDNFASYGYWSCFKLLHDVKKNKIKIIAFEYGFNDEENVLFQGEIKNKSELKRLLKQLNIL